MIKEIADYKETVRQGQPVKPLELVTSINLGVQWLIVRLSKEGIPFKVLQLGAGVKRITTDVQVCPKCNGTGRC
jgi:hypothetical protein